MKKQWVVRLWGGLFNEQKQFGIVKEGYTWFDTEGEKDRYIGRAKECAKSRGEVVAWSSCGGEHATKKCLAKMTLSFNGNDYPFIYDFGYGYQEDDALFMFTDGNYGCDCNLSILLKRSGIGIDELPCGHTIEIKDLRIEYVEAKAE